MSGLTATFDLRGLDQGDPVAVEARWNAWVKALLGKGFRPSEDPISYSDDGSVHALFAVGGPRDHAEYAANSGEAVVPDRAIA